MLKINITQEFEDEDLLADTLRLIADQIGDGYNGGFSPDWRLEEVETVELVVCKHCRQPADGRGDDYFCPNGYCRNDTVLPFRGYTDFTRDVDDSQFEIIDVTQERLKQIQERYPYAAEH